MADKKEQEMREEIVSFLAKKDYYDILGVSKQATDPEIKKAYRSLALRFHPDKNQYDGAKEVFKKVSNAYSTLIDAQKKAHYDRFGAEEDRPRQQQYHYRQANQEDYEFEQYDDLFRAFFGGMPMHGRRRGNVYAYQQANPEQQAQARQANMTFYGVFVVFFVIYAIAPFFESRPNYSNYPSNEHKYRVTTPKLNVEYYVNQKFFQEARNPDYKRKAEMIIDREYVSSLEKHCEASKRDKRRLQEYAYREKGTRRDYLLQQSRMVNLNTCRNIQNLYENHENYMRDLAYMR